MRRSGWALIVLNLSVAVFSLGFALITQTWWFLVFIILPSLCAGSIYLDLKKWK